jgi:ABC-type branched-subunit amino acid transport system substrate-binding protein
MFRLLFRVGLIIICLALVTLFLPGCSSNTPTTSAPDKTTPAAVPTTASAASSVPQTTSGSAVFRIGFMGQMSGDAGAAVTRLFQEFEYMMKYTNDVEGGISGVKLEWKMVDNRGTADGAVMAYKQLRDSFKPNLYVQVEDFLLAGLMPTLQEDKPVIVCSSAIVPAFYNPPGRIFSFSMPTVDGFAAYLNWVQSNWKGSGNPKVGVLYWSDNQSAQAWQGAQAWGAKKNIDFVGVTYSITSLDVKTQLLKLKDSNVNYIWAHSITPNAAVIVRDATAMGIAKQIPITFMEYVESEGLLNQAGAAAEGFYGYQAHSPYSEKTPAANLYSQIWKQEGNKDVWSDNRQMITLKGLMDALIPKVATGVKSNTLTSDTVLNALNGLSNIDTWGNNQDFSYSPTKRVGMSAIKIFQYTKTGTTVVGDWFTMPRLFEGAEK